MVLYALATSQIEAWDPSGNLKMMRDTVEKVPHVQGKSCRLIAELIDETGFVDDWHGWEKSCTPQNLPGFPGLGTRERGDDWKGPMIDSRSACKKGPRYLPLWNYFSTISSYSAGNLLMERLLVGTYD